MLAENERLKRGLAVARARVGELEARADIDPLLDVLNRRGFERELKRALSHVKRYGTQAALMFVDLDGFKGINDRYGHGAGDALLKAVARELMATCGRPTSSAASAATSSVSSSGGSRRSRRRQSPRAGDDDCPRRHHPRQEPDLGAASIGVAPLVEDANPGDVIAAADKSMYARKDERRGLPAAVSCGE